MSDNFYVGADEYFIRFQNGIHYLSLVHELDGYRADLEVICFGTYEECIRELNKARRGYLESLY